MLSTIKSTPAGNYIQGIFSVLFFMWGLLTVLNFVLLDHLAYVFDLSYSLSTLINLTFFSTYLIVSLKAGAMIKSVGYKKGIIIGWLLALAGCFVFFIAVVVKNFNIFLGALFLQAAGITILQVGANLYVVLYGPARTAASRLNFVQAFNSLGTVIAPLLIVLLRLIVHHSGNSKSFLSSEEFSTLLHLPYLFLGVLMTLFAGILFYAKIPNIDIKNIEPWNRMPYHPRRHVMHFPQLRLGAFAIFAYVGAEVALNNYLVDFAEENVKYYWGAAMIGRFVGAYILTKISTRLAVGFAAGMAAFLVIISIITSGVGTISIWSITLVGLFNSILFPSIYSLGINGLGKFSLDGSGVLIMSIAGGAVIPFMVRNFSLMKGFPPELSIQLAFIIPVICYAYILVYGLRLSRFRRRKALVDEVPTVL